LAVFWTVNHRQIEGGSGEPVVSTPDQRAADIAAHQHSHITRPQLREAGLTDEMIDGRAAAGLLIGVHRGVFRYAGAPLTWAGRAMAGVLASPDGALISHLCAAHLWGLDGFRSPGIIDVTVDFHSKNRTRPGLRVHESKAFHLRGATTRKGIPCTGIARTLLDICAAVDNDYDALRALDSARRRHLVSWDELWRCLVLHAARGRNGIARYRRILVKRHGKRVPDMDIAAMTLELLLDAGLPEPESEVWAVPHPYRIDLAYPELKIAIECIGKEGHLNDVAFEYDPVRRNALLLDGWIVLEVTWRRLTEEPAEVVREVREALRLRRARAS
jgi:hypothetical protein